MTEEAFLRMLVDAEKSFEAIEGSLTDEAARKLAAALAVLRRERDTGPEATKLLRQIAGVIESCHVQLVDGTFIAERPIDDDVA